MNKKYQTWLFYRCGICSCRYNETFIGSSQDYEKFKVVFCPKCGSYGRRRSIVLDRGQILVVEEKMEF